MWISNLWSTPSTVGQEQVLENYLHLNFIPSRKFHHWKLKLTRTLWNQRIYRANVPPFIPSYQIIRSLELTNKQMQPTQRKSTGHCHQFIFYYWFTVTIFIVHQIWNTMILRSGWWVMFCGRVWFVGWMAITECAESDRWECYIAFHTKRSSWFSIATVAICFWLVCNNTGSTKFISILKHTILIDP